MRYEEVTPISRDEAFKALATNDRDTVSGALLRLALHEKDRTWVEQLLVQFMQHQDPWVRGVAATCVGHVARIHRQLDHETTLSALKLLLNDPATAGKAQDALDDIEVFIVRKGLHSRDPG
jgi:hypothetical protein